MGGTLNLIAGLLYLIVVLALMAGPYHLAAGLTEHDLPRTWHVMVRRGPAGGLGFSAVGDGGFNSPGFVGEPSEQQPKRGPLWFRQMDHNGDGYLSDRFWPRHRTVAVSSNRVDAVKHDITRLRTSVENFSGA